MWNERYSKPGYLFGTDPAQFLCDHTAYLTAGKTALCVADGEGRNSVYMAGRGMDVRAMDGSDVAVEKARALALVHQIDVDFNVADIMGWDWDAAEYDVVAAVFIQFVGLSQRAEIFDGMMRAVKPGGVLMLHGYTPKQLEFGTGGPRRLENLYTVQMLRDAFADFEMLELKAYEQVIDEGEGHSGRSALVDMVVRKPLLGA